MKTIYFLAGLLLVCFTISSCDEDDLEGLLPAFDVKLVKTENIPVHIDQTDGNWVTFSGKTTLSIVNSDTKDHLNKIKKLSINKLSFKIINFNGDQNGEVDGKFSVAGQVSLNKSFVVKTAADGGTVYEITETAELNRIISELQGGQSVDVDYAGSALCNDADMDFTVEVTLDVTVKIDP